MAQPTDFSAVEDNDYSFLFYTRSDGALAVAKSSTTQQANDTVYKSSNVIVTGNIVTSPSTRVSAVAYTKDGQRQIRVYYITGNDDEGYQLSEICQTNGGEWFQGSLDGNNLQCSKTSLLSANVEFGVGDLKIFYQDPKGNPRIAWVVLGQTAWASTKVNPSPFKW